MKLNKNDRCLLLVMPRPFAQELKECHRYVPEPGESGTITDSEAAGDCLATDSVEVRFDNKPDDPLWMPEFFLRRLNHD